MATRLPVPPRLQPVDQRLIAWMDRHGVRLLRVTIGVVFIWFGALKLFPGASPAAGLIVSTYPFLPPGLFLPFLGCWEMAIGLGYLTGRFLRVTVALMYAQMLGGDVADRAEPGSRFRGGAVRADPGRPVHRQEPGPAGRRHRHRREGALTVTPARPAG